MLKPTCCVSHSLSFDVISTGALIESGGIYRISFTISDDKFTYIINTRMIAFRVVIGNSLAYQLMQCLEGLRFGQLLTSFCLQP